MLGPLGGGGLSPLGQKKGGAPFTPTSLSNLALWLSGRTLGSLFQDSAQTIPVTTAGQPVGAWRDLSGGNHHFVQSTAGARPTYTATGMNGQPGINLDGTDDFLQNATLTAASGDRTIVVVSDPGAAASNIVPYLDVESGRLLLTHRTNSTGQVGWFDGAWQSVGATSAAAQVLTWHFAGTTGTMYRNGVTLTPATHAPKPLGGLLVMGLRFTGSAPAYPGVIAEMLIYNRALTAGELTSLHGYLNAAYGGIY